MHPIQNNLSRISNRKTDKQVNHVQKIKNIRSILHLKRNGGEGVVREFDDKGQPIYVDENDVIISKVIEQVDKSGNTYYTDNSIFLKRTQQGYVDKVYIDTQNDGLKSIHWLGFKGGYCLPSCQTFD